MKIIVGRLASGVHVDVRLSQHALERYAERVKPGRDPSSAAKELERLASLCPIREGAPRWLRTTRRPLFHLDLGTISVLLDPDPRERTRLLTRTVVTTGCFPNERRRARKRRKQNDRRIPRNPTRTPPR